MPKSNIVKALDELEKTDIYSMMLFALYKLNDKEEYSTLSELSYVLNGENLINFLTYYGGSTIKVPTIAELKRVIEALILYNYVNIEEIEFAQALKMLDNKDDPKLKEIKETYFKLVEILKDYSFKRS